MKKSIRSIKIYFSVVIALLTVIFIGGALYFGENGSVLGNFSEPDLSESEAFNQKFKYLETKIPQLVYDGSPKTYPVQNAKFVKVLIYHGISEYDDNESTTWDKFRDQMFALKKAGYETVKLSEFDDFLKGKAVLPDKSFLLTFDDGRKDSYYPVQPILDVLNYNAVMFVITSRMGNKETFHLKASEIKDMLDSGRWEIGSHSQGGHGYVEMTDNGETGHFFSNRMWLDSKGAVEDETEFSNRIWTDLLGAKSDIIRKFNVPAFAFAVPYGDYGQVDTNYPESKNIILEASKNVYSLFFYQTWDLEDTENYPLLNPFMVKRISVEPTWTADYLIQVVEKP